MTNRYIVNNVWTLIFYLAIQTQLSLAFSIWDLCVFVPFLLDIYVKINCELFINYLSSFGNLCPLLVCVCVCVAVKAGGMRIVQKHQPTATPEPPQKDDDEEEYVSSRYHTHTVMEGLLLNGHENGGQEDELVPAPEPLF